MNSYQITTARLGLRNWQTDDLAAMIRLNQDEAVMRFFPGLTSPEDTSNFIKKMQAQFAERQYCYFAVDRLDQEAFIGFIGLSYQDYESPYTPAVDIGWRLARSTWNQGFATEGAVACLDYAFTKIGLEKVISIAPEINVPSQRVMEKIGMQKIGNFKHPKLAEHPRIENCVVYEKRL
ncbi:MAG: GNAT family N-acetyltransferase [Saprospiraceae bacterium]